MKIDIRKKNFNDRQGSQVKVVFLLIFCLVINLLFTQDLISAFREVNLTPRSGALGGAVSVLVEDGVVLVYNPGGLGMVGKRELGFSHTKLYNGLDGVDIGLNNGIVTIPFKVGVFGLVYNEFNEISYKERTFILGYGNKLFNLENFLGLGEMDLYGGVNVKYLQNQFILDDRSSGDIVFSGGNSKGSYTLDLGVLAEVSGVRLGLSGKNLTQPNVGLYIEEKLPFEFRLGFGYKIRGRSIVMLDVSYRGQEWGKEEDKFNYHLGFESEIVKDIFTLLVGGNVLESGVGFMFKVPAKVSFDSYINFSFSFSLPYYVTNTSGNYRVGIVLKK